MKLKIKKLVPNAIIPTRSFPSDAGADLHTVSEYTVVRPGEGHKFSTGIACDIPDGHYLHIHTRSSMAKKGFTVVGGICDSSYKGELFVVLRNLSNEPLSVLPGDRIAQVVLYPIVIPDIIEVEDIGSSERSNSGFGSSGR